MKLIYTSILAILLAFTSHGQSNIYVGDIINNIKIGPLTGNKNLSFGIKNIAEEAILDKGYNLVSKNDSSYKINLEIIKYSHHTLYFN